MRRIALTALVTLVVVSAGCTGLLTDDTVAFDADEASVSDSALDSTGYEGTNSTEQTIQRNVSVGGEERTIRITNHYAVYARSGTVDGVETPEMAQFVVFSSPGAEIANQTLNPVAQLSNRQLVERVSDRTGGVSDVAFVENRTAESLGSERAVGVFSGTTTVGGEEIDVRIHVTNFEHESDVIVAVGVHPAEVAETENVDELLAGIEHSGDED